MKRPIYLDNHATTPVDPRVLEAMLEYYKHEFGNASSSTHSFGWKAKTAVEKARAQVAKLIGSRPDEIIFTSGATESNNWALFGILAPGDHVISTRMEHPSVLACLEELRGRDVKVDLVEPGIDGQINPEDIKRCIKSKTKLITVMFANNEVGTIYPVAPIAKLARENGILFHCDAVQATGRVPIDVNELKIDFLSLSGHKMYGPKGVGALFVHREVKERIKSLMVGGGQEKGLRAGTLNVPGIVGLGVASEIALNEGIAECQRIEELRDRLWEQLRESIPRIKLNGSMSNRLCGNLNFCIEGVDGEGLLLAVQNQIAISTSSACCSGGKKGSRVLSALGLSLEDIQCSFRVGIGRFNTKQDIDLAAKALSLAQSSPLC